MITAASAGACSRSAAATIRSRLARRSSGVAAQRGKAAAAAASRVSTFFAITLPIIAPSLLAGWLLAFTLSLDDVVIASFLSGPSSTTLPIKIFASVKLGVSPKINALATIMVMAVSLIAVAGWGLMARSEKRRNREIQQALKDNG